MLSELKPGRELTRAFDERLLARYYAAAKQGSRQNLSNGDPLTIPFSPIAKAVTQAMRGSEMSLYTRGGGPKKFREKVLPYCESIGISPTKEILGTGHITFGIGSTFLYSTILKILARRSNEKNPGKTPVLIMPSPTYGIFTMQPENAGFQIETFDLSEKDGWQIDPNILSNRIKEINDEKDRYVAALYHANPHNPTGAVATGDQTQKIMRVLKRHKVFAIDDMAYSGIEHRGKAVPLASHDFDNSVTLFTLSKAYCMPRTRAGVACGPQWLIDQIDHQIDMNMISMPAAVFAAAAACFSDESKIEREEQYLPANCEVYRQHFDVMKAVINGIDSVEGLSNSRVLDILSEAEKAYGSLPKARQILKTGMPNLRIINDNPEAGYFAIVRVEGLDEMFYGTTRLTNSFQFATAAVDVGKVLTLPLNLALAGDSLKDGLRLTFGGMQEKTLIKALKGLNDTITKLPRKPDAAQQEVLVKSGKALGRDLIY